MLPLSFFLIKASYSRQQTTTNIKHVIRFYDALEIFRFPYENIMISALYDVHKVTSGNPTRRWMGRSKFASGKSLIHSEGGFGNIF